MKVTERKIYVNYKDIEGWVATIGREIMLNDWKPDYIVGLTRGGLLPATLLSQLLNVEMYALNVSLRDFADSTGPESNCWMAEDAFGYIDKEKRENESICSDPAKRRNILIVDDINDTGATLAWIQNDWTSTCLPGDDAWDDVWTNNVRTAVLVNNEASEWQTGVDYLGLEINKAEKDYWVVFPWEDWWGAKP